MVGQTQWQHKKRIVRKVQITRSSDWQYLGTVCVGAGGALALTGSITLYNYQQGSVLNTRHIPYFLPILLVGIAVAVLGIAAFIMSVQRRRHEIPPPPLPPPPPPPPPQEQLLFHCNIQVLRVPAQYFLELMFHG
jgi:hypothetical protein